MALSASDSLQSEDELERRAIADVLWEGMFLDPPKPEMRGRLRNAYRRRLYGPVVEQATTRIRRHVSPDPWLTARCLLEWLAGDGYARSKRRFEGIQGGRTTEDEYRPLLKRTKLPVLFVAGYPRSGTTSLQTVVRTAFQPNVPEIRTSEMRFSLWDFPKHSFETAIKLAQFTPAAVEVIWPVRPFVDCAASLVVGRGGYAHVDLSTELQLWESWVPAYLLPSTIVLPFAVVQNSSPTFLQALLEGLTATVASSPIPHDATYASLMLQSGKGDPDSPNQSNLPATARARALSEAREWVQGQLGSSELERLTRIYSSLPLSIDPAGT